MRRRRERMLVSVLFTDIVGSIQLFAELGERRWRGLLARHNRFVRRQLRSFGGRELRRAADGFFAVFSSQENAIRCACSISEGVREFGIEIRAGVHAGQAEVLGRRVGGVVVHVGALITAMAGPGDVLVSSEVAEAVKGRGFGFDDRGVHTLREARTTIHVYAVTAVDSEPRTPPADPEIARERRELIEPAPARLARAGLLAAAAMAVVAIALTILALTH